VWIEYDRSERTADEVRTRPTGDLSVEHSCGEQGRGNDGEQLKPILGQ
jgi:hypothetical protein